MNNYQQHMLRNTDQFRDFLKNIYLNKRPIIEIGIGTGVLTNLLHDLFPDSPITGYEIDQNLVPDQLNEFVSLFIGDFRHLADKCFAVNKNAVLISCPPYNLLPLIAEKIEISAPDMPFLLMVPPSKMHLFQNYTIEFQVPNTHFDPQATGEHFVISSGFNQFQYKR